MKTQIMRIVACTCLIMGVSLMGFAATSGATHYYMHRAEHVKHVGKPGIYGEGMIAISAIFIPGVVLTVGASVALASLMSRRYAGRKIKEVVVGAVVSLLIWLPVLFTKGFIRALRWPAYCIKDCLPGGTWTIGYIDQFILGCVVALLGLALLVRQSREPSG